MRSAMTEVVDWQAAGVSDSATIRPVRDGRWWGAGVGDCAMATMGGWAVQVVGGWCGAGCLGDLCRVADARDDAMAMVVVMMCVPVVAVVRWCCVVVDVPGEWISDAMCC